ncbi:MAG: HD domain-containing protein [Candidatus Omnitrophota bacterium]|nr:HD domain-containing protein [Candidatus Omnitrophota bacterium]
MHKDPPNWATVQDWFFDKVLGRKEKPGSQLKLPVKQQEHFSKREKFMKIDYQNALLDASRSMIRFRKPFHLIKMIDEIINKNVGVTHLAVLLYDSGRNSYVLIDSKGRSGSRIPVGYVKLDSRNPLIELFKKKKNVYLSDSGAIDFKELKSTLDSGAILNIDTFIHNKLRLALKEMELLNAGLCVPCFFKKELLGILILGRKISGRDFARGEMNLFATLANDAAMAIANARLIENLQKKVDEIKHLYRKEHKLFINTVIALAAAIDARDSYTHGHAARVTNYCLSIADELRVLPEISSNSHFMEMLRITALLHDIGKIGIPDKVLNKKKGLNASERKIVERHPDIGGAILSPVQELGEIAKCVRLHQEWYNGKGYPYGLERDSIPLISRIVSVADAFDAMTTDRPYRKKKNLKETRDEIKKYSGTQFDSQVVEAFLRAHKKGKIDNANEQNLIDKISSLC